MLMAAENQIHVVFEPNWQTPSELIFRVQGSQFEKMQSPHRPQFDKFYSDAKQFEPLLLDDEQDYEVCNLNVIFVSDLLIDLS